jgi:two-component system phosphate regulon response regulator PhoB
MVFDIDARFREAVKTALTSLGCETVFAADGYSVPPMAQEHRPSLVILDYKLPEAAGFEILQRLRRAPGCEAIPVIFASVTPKFEIEMNVMDTPAVGYIDKPLDVRQLKEAVEALVGPLG